MKTNAEILKIFKNMINSSLLDTDKVYLPLLYSSIRVKKNRNDVIDSYNNISNYRELKNAYSNILSSTIELFRTLKVTNSLDICNIYTYLLWNGYFSTNKKLKYESDNRALIYSLLPADIMTGRGVCINFSAMLKDILTKLNYKNASLACSIKYVKIDQTPRVKREFSDKDSKQNVFDFFNNKFSCNHVVNLLLDSGKLYIYDPTNLMLLKPRNKCMASVVNGDGKYKLYPFLSYSLNFSESSTSTLDKIILQKQFSYYRKEDYYKSWDYCLDKIKSNKELLDLFYDKISLEIEKISYDVEKIKQLNQN